MTMEGPQNSHVKKETQKNEKCHGPSRGPGRAGCYGTHFNAGMSIAMKSIISVVPFTMRTKNLHVIPKKNRRKPRRIGAGICLHSLAVDSRGTSVQNGAFR